MSSTTSPAISARPLARPSKKVRGSEVIGRPLNLPRLLETLDTDQLRTVLERICESHPAIGHEVVTQAPRPSVDKALEILQSYEDKFKAAMPYGNSSAEYTYYRVKDAMVAFIEALADFTPQFLPPNETQPTKSLQFLDSATTFIHNLPDWEPQAYRHHKESAYEDIAKAWTLVIEEGAKRAGGFNLHSGGWDQVLGQHNATSGGRLNSAVAAMANNIGWMGTGGAASGNNPDSILDSILSGAYNSPVRVGPW